MNRRTALGMLGGVALAALAPVRALGQFARTRGKVIARRVGGVDVVEFPAQVRSGSSWEGVTMQIAREHLVELLTAPRPPRDKKTSSGG